MSISDTFVVIPFRDSVDGVRFKNLRVVLEHFKNVHLRTCVVQQGGPVKDMSYADSYLVCDDAASLQKSRLMNTAGRYIKEKYGAKYLLFNDADVLVSPSALEKGAGLLASGLFDIVHPFYAIVFLRESETIAMGSRFECGTIKNGQTGLFKASPGGSIFVAVPFFAKIQGFPEQFEGYGFEDNAFLRKVAEANGRYKRLSDFAFHLIHESFAFAPIGNEKAWTNFEPLAQVDSWGNAPHTVVI